MVPIPQNVQALLLALGALALARFVFSVLRFFFRHFVRGGKDLKKYGSWAVVTGATDGIGRAMADELARQGINIVLISRTQSKLDAAAKDIVAEFQVECITLAVDFSSFGRNSGNHEKVSEAIEGLDVGILVNNVGQSYPFPQFYLDIEADLIDSLDSINMESVTWMTRLVLPGMVDRKRGAVVNISSIAGVLPSPLLAQYSASKAFVEYHTKSLATEYKGKGIDFQVRLGSIRSSSSSPHIEINSLTLANI
jgi:17beta-estradiol 17-dehydrogenase / very-long-chain 3-oxoacyl-CoA reductase